jgi:hypothetical protein
MVHPVCDIPQALACFYRLLLGYISVSVPGIKLDATCIFHKTEINFTTYYSQRVY